MTSRVARPGLIRQGDVLLIPVDPDVVEGAAPGSRRVLDRIDGRLVLAEGEATGHAHAIVDGHVRLEEQEFGELREVWRNRWAWSGSRTVLIVEGSPATLQHEEHGHLAVPPGGYLVRRQREYVPRAGREAGWRRVAD